jgi:prepilin-type N-terminal cleavage/methylation domain-containing protein
MKKHSNGFTLIELLVVIAIIGILASVVLASLNTARAKGANATIKSNLVNIRTQAALYFESNAGSYGAVSTCLVNADGSTVGTCTGNVTGDTVVQSLLRGAAQKNTQGYARMNVATTPSAAYAAYAYLRTPENGNAVWCVDSTGASKGVPTHWSNGATVCP